MFFLRKNMSIFGSEAGGKNKKLDPKRRWKNIFQVCLFALYVLYEHRVNKTK